MSQSSTCISSSGKVLAAGGYLVLDPAYSGVVISTSSRFYAVVRNSNPPRPCQIRVKSPQFLGAIWNYTVDIRSDGISVTPITDEHNPRNKFVHLALQHTLALVREIKGGDGLQASLSEGFDIVIAGHNDFYSQRASLEALNLPRSIASLAKIPPFNFTNVKLEDVHKTGLGSSAALITSLVSSILQHCSAVTKECFLIVDSPDRRLAHNLAQFIHCLAQGKVGSGFDVSSAVYGSQLYTRFDPTVIEDLMNEDPAHPRPLLPILSPVNPAWTHVVRPFKLPPLTKLMLADVDAGSDTPSLVGKVLRWRKADTERADILWKSLDRQNMLLAKLLTDLSDLYSSDSSTYTNAVRILSSLPHDQWPANNPTIGVFRSVHQCSETIREKMREMGSLCDVPIEPAEQTRLLDSCITQAGVIAGGVPGAGGYDALWLLIADLPNEVVSAENPLSRVEHVWSTWKELDVSPLSAVESIAKGARLETVEDVPGLVALLR